LLLDFLFVMFTNINIHSDPTVVGCPNGMLNVQLNCSVQINNETRIHESYLGLMGQQVPTSTGYYCLEIKEAVSTVASLWNGTVFSNSSDNLCAYQKLPGIFDVIPFTEQWTILATYGGFLAMMMLCTLLTYLTTLRRGNKDANNKVGAGGGSKSQRARSEHYPSYTDLSKRTKNMLKREVNDAFERVAEAKCQPYLAAAKKRLVALILDNGYADSANTASAVKIVYLRYMEGYRIYRRHILNEETPDIDDTPTMLDRLALWNIVSQYASSMNHAPEKVAQIYHDLQEQSIKQKRPVTQEELMATFKILYQVYRDGFNYEDINESAIDQTTDPRTSCYPQNGGIVASLYHYLWVVRLDVWIVMLAFFLIESDVYCISSILEILAPVDSGLKALSFFIYTFFVTSPKGWKMVPLKRWRNLRLLEVAYLGIFVVLLLNIFMLKLSSNLSSLLNFAYCGGAALVCLIEEAYLCFRRSAFRLPGRINQRQGWWTNFSEVTRGMAIVLFYSIWFIIVLLFNMTLIRSLSGLTPENLCSCELNPSQFEQTVISCGPILVINCRVAIMFAKIAAGLVSLIMLFISFQLVLVLFGVITATIKGISKIKYWEQVQDYHAQV